MYHNQSIRAGFYGTELQVCDYLHTNTNCYNRINSQPTSILLWISQLTLIECPWFALICSCPDSGCSRKQNLCLSLYVTIRSISATQLSFSELCCNTSVTSTKPSAAMLRPSFTAPCRNNHERALLRDISRPAAERLCNQNNNLNYYSKLELIYLYFPPSIHLTAILNVCLETSISYFSCKLATRTINPFWHEFI